MKHCSLKKKREKKNKKKKRGRREGMYLLIHSL